MLEWMNDENVVHYMKTDFAHKTLEDCREFIASAQDSSRNMHLAVADNNDTYLRTISFKNIEINSAEFAITMTKAAIGKGYAAEAMRQIIEMGLNELQLKHIYWCVSPENKRAIRFYDKNWYQSVTFDELCKTMNISKTAMENRGVQTRRSKNFHLVFGTKRQSNHGAVNLNQLKKLNMIYLSTPLQKFTEENDV